MAKLFKYKLTESQYHRFVDDPDTTYELYILGKPLGVLVKDATDGVNNWVFTGTCEGTAGLKKVGDFWYCYVNMTNKPWYVPWFIYDMAFKSALK